MKSPRQVAGPEVARRRVAGRRVAGLRVILVAGAAAALVSVSLLGSGPAGAASLHAKAEAAHSARIAPTPGLISKYADTDGPILIDNSGQGFVSWDSPAPDGKPANVWFCKIQAASQCTSPLHLVLPAKEQVYGITQVYPVFGSEPGTVYLVAPSYAYGNEVIWTSQNWAASFGAGEVTPADTYADKTSVNDVLLTPDGTPSRTFNYMNIASTNPGAGYSFTGPEITSCSPGVCAMDFNAIEVDGTTLGYSGQQRVEAYSQDTNPPAVGYYWSPNGTPHSWSGAVKVADGTDVRLADGPGGLFLLSLDYSTPSASEPTKIDVRKWNATTHTFGAPTTIVNDTASSGSTSIGGLTEDTATGALYVAWPGNDSKEGGSVMREWVSTDGGKVFGAAKYVALVGAKYFGPVRMAMRNGKGFLTFGEASGLRLVNLS